MKFKKFLLFSFVFIVMSIFFSNKLYAEKLGSWDDNITVEKVSDAEIEAAYKQVRGASDRTLEFNAKAEKLNPGKLADLMGKYKQAEEEGDIVNQKKFLKIIKNQGGEAVELVGGQYNLTVLFGNLMNVVRYVGVILTEVAYYLLGLLTLLEGLSLLMENPTDLPIGKIMMLLIKYALLRFLIRFWFNLMTLLKMDIKDIAGVASGMGKGFSIHLAPQNIFDILSRPLTTSWELLGITDVLWGLLLIPGIILSTLIAIEFFMAELEFYLLAGFGIILIPFLAWKQTLGIGTKIGAILSSQLARLLFMYFFLMTVLNLIPNNPFPFYVFGTPGITLTFKYTVILYALYIFVGKSQALASSLMAGGVGTFGARDARSAFGGAIARGIGLIAAGVGLTSVGAKFAKSDFAKNTFSKFTNTMRGAANVVSKSSEEKSSDDK